MNKEQKNFKKFLLLPILGLFGLASAHGPKNCYPPPPSGWVDGNCSFYTADGTCLQCAPYFYLKQETGFCTEVSSQCKTYSN